MHIYGHCGELQLGVSKWRQKKRKYSCLLGFQAGLGEQCRGCTWPSTKSSVVFFWAVWGLPFDKGKLWFKWSFSSHKITFKWNVCAECDKQTDSEKGQAFQQNLEYRRRAKETRIQLQPDESQIFFLPQGACTPSSCGGVSQAFHCSMLFFWRNRLSHIAMSWQGVENTKSMKVWLILRVQKRSLCWLHLCFLSSEVSVGTRQPWHHYRFSCCEGLGVLCAFVILLLCNLSNSRAKAYFDSGNAGN